MTTGAATGHGTDGKPHDRQPAGRRADEPTGAASAGPACGTTTPGRSAYGLRVHGLDEVAELGPARECRPDAPAVRVGQAAGPPPGPLPLDGRRGVRVLADGRHLALDRDRGRATFYGPPLAADLLAHPYLGAVATVFNRWAGREAFHAGAFVLGGRAWALLGPRTAGKSSLLAALAAARVPVLTDDILVVDGTTGYAGPRCLDLRRPVPGLRLDCRPARRDSRSRVLLPPVPARVPLGGWLFLSWGEALGMTPLGAPELLARLACRRSWRNLPSDPATMLALATLPAWDLVRPPDWRLLDATCRLLTLTLTGSPAPAPTHTSAPEPMAEPEPVPAPRSAATTATGAAATAQAVRGLALDALVVRTATALRDRGIASVLLKGAGLAHRLRNAGSRRYDDVDLLVAPATFDAAQRVLRDLGYRPILAGARQDDWAHWHARPWRAPGPAALTVDLHRGFAGVADPVAFWSAVSTTAERLDLAGGTVAVPDEPCAALLVALHAASPGRSGRPGDDLARALAVLPAATWRVAAGIARRTGAVPAFAVALRRDARGDALATELGLPRRTAVTGWLAAHRGRSAAYSLARLAELPTCRARLRHLGLRLVPSPAAMRHAYPLAGRGVAGLLLAYLVRAGDLARRTPGGLRELRIASRRAGGDQR
ncbi:nucleotidyltransferase family protein [Plantactinospora sp. BB1]|uniref:nucleotidyltransferase family protein n=1 Tax=Plantactinospora sp. BB1 TaxID=2071627 RepID=UPI000D164072|nr:nucleotidyltransferase family protein [Plantactinospora sp. BB1]AVT39503.1 hypothetical protein C6W10_27115 [Plantactinospora sp. BB1]